MSQHFLNLIRNGDTAKIAADIEANPTLARCRDAQGVSALMWSVYVGQPAVRDLLRQHVTDLDISEAACLGDCECMHRLIAGDAMLAREVSADGWPPLHLSAAFAGPQAVTLLLEHGAHIHQVSHNALRNQALHACIALANSVEVARILLEAGADVNATAAGGYTPLHLAASNGNREIVSLLLEHGANCEALCDQSKSSADYARDRGHNDVVALLA
ncbi:MAG TPA: ankyrin repeat domain-containing protein [Silvibacterium sp.]|nr:ankyrin repeat domain-containing protein [Silvibacterium sp.]